MLFQLPHLRLVLPLPRLGAPSCAFFAMGVRWPRQARPEGLQPFRYCAAGIGLALMRLTSKPDWWEQLQSAAIEVEVSDTIRHVGPPNFRELTDQQAMALLKSPALHRFVENYDSEPAVLIGETALAKVLPRSWH